MHFVVGPKASFPSARTSIHDRTLCGSPAPRKQTVVHHWKLLLQQLPKKPAGLRVHMSGCPWHRRTNLGGELKLFFANYWQIDWPLFANY